MIVEVLGDRAYLLRDLPAPAYELAASLNASTYPGLIEAVASYETLALYVDPTEFDAQGFVLPPPTVVKSRRHRIPVCYERGPDLDVAANSLGLGKDDLIRLHVQKEYRCYAVGFSPGFPYLGTLDDRIAGVPRLPNPRKRVDPGMVGITGTQTGVYPSMKPGGWALIGQTPLTLVDVEDDYFPIEAGDVVQFERIASDEFSALEGQRL